MAARAGIFRSCCNFNGKANEAENGLVNVSWLIQAVVAEPENSNWAKASTATGTANNTIITRYAVIKLTVVLRNRIEQNIASTVVVRLAKATITM